MKKEMNPWTIISSEEKYDNPWINLTEYQVINPNGGKGIYGKVHFKNLAIGIIPINKNDEIILIGQYRFPLDVYSWEIPEGGGKLDINPLDSAKRELLEETGLKANKWTKLMEMHLSNSDHWSSFQIYLKSHRPLGPQPKSHNLWLVQPHLLGSCSSLTLLLLRIHRALSQGDRFPS